MKQQRASASAMRLHELPRRRGPVFFLQITFALVLASGFLTGLTYLRLGDSVFGFAAGDSYERDDYYPPREAGNDLIAREMAAEELFHLNRLYDACRRFPNSIIPSSFGEANEASISTQLQLLINETSINAQASLSTCESIDIFLPANERTDQNCMNAVAYLKFLKGRLLPEWVLEVKGMKPYLELCPRHPVLSFNEGFLSLSNRMKSLSTRKKLFLSPSIVDNVLSAEHLHQSDAVLCKTATCHQRVSKWYQQHGNPRNVKVFYTRFTSPDHLSNALMQLSVEAVKPKDFNTPRFLHVVSDAPSQGTELMLKCWLMQSGLPPLDIVIDEVNYNKHLRHKFGSRLSLSKNVFVSHKDTHGLAMSKRVAETAYFLYPDVLSDYPHHINQARAAGGFIITTDSTPMNEVVTEIMGLRIPVKRQVSAFHQMLGGGHTSLSALRSARGLEAHFTSRELCDAIENLLKNIPVETRRAMAARSRQQYFIDQRFFARAMDDVRMHAGLEPLHNLPEH